MPYCSIEEAWGQNFLSNKNQPKRFKKIVPEFANSNKLGYSSIEIPQSNIYDSNAKSIFCPKKSKKSKRRRSFSRTYNRLPEHSGPETRLPKKIVKKQLSFKNNKFMSERKRNNSMNNIDLPINEYDKIVEQEMNDNDYIEEEYNNDTNENFTNNDYINQIVEENRKLKNLLNKFQTQSYDKDGIFDLVVFISTGIFLIFLLDLITKGIRKF